MTLKERCILVQDLFSRIPYGVYVEYNGIFGMVHHVNIYPKYDGDTIIDYICDIDFFNDRHCIDIEYFTLFLRPMSSMSDEERKDFYENIRPQYDGQPWKSVGGDIDWLLSHHFDFRGLIEMGLALEAKDGMYK